MARPKTEKHSSDLGAEILRLEQEKRRLIQIEDQRRGALIRETLASLNGDQLRAILRPLIGPRDAFLFDLDSDGIDAEPVVDKTDRSRPSRRSALASNSPAEETR